jgi:predicted transcriptional regulator
MSETPFDEQVYTALRQSGGTIEHIAKAVATPRAEVAQALERLREAGRAERRWMVLTRGAKDWKYFAVERVDD